MKKLSHDDGNVDVCLGRNPGQIDSWFITFLTDKTGRKVYFKYLGNEQAWNFDYEPMIESELTALLLSHQEIQLSEALGILEGKNT
jgi:hypothetical protein